jgi:ribosomal protein S18 acetylase RimI-like enzyme
MLLMEDLYQEDGDIALDPPAAETALRELAGRPDLGELWVAADQGRIIGYLAITWGFSLEYHGRDAFVDELYLAPEYRGRGLGRRALEVAEAACRARGVRALHLEVERANARAEALYRQHGFSDHDRRLMTRRIV